MFVIVVLAVMLSLAAPSFSNLIRDQRVKTIVGDIHSTLIYARSEAIKRNQFVAVCAKTDDGFGCQNSTDWARGWIVYLDTDGNGFPGAVSDILKRQDTITGLAISGTGTNITYPGDGRLRAAEELPEARFHYAPSASGEEFTLQLTMFGPEAEQPADDEDADDGERLGG
jgi:type IV fimbrial biogenesis protein FimT